MFRKILFWLHLLAGLIAGLAIGIMCFTGTVVAFEKQIVAWSERDARQVTPPGPDAPRLSLDQLTARVGEHRADARLASIVVSSDPRAAVAFSLGRDDTVYANPYTGEVRKPASSAVHDFMHTMIDWHRWLALSGDQRPIGKAINGACNLAFCFLALSGLYLWMPRTWSWRGVRAIAAFNWRLTGKARDFNWHNTIGLWCAPVLIVLTLTAVPISYRWGNNLVYRLVGESPPQQPGPGAAAAPAVPLPPAPEGAYPLPRDAQFTAVGALFPGWQQITLRLMNPSRGGSSPAAAPSAPRSADEARRGPQPATFVVKTAEAWPRTATATVVLNPFTGEVLRRESFGDLSTGRQIRTWTRFLHTGEALGWWGQLIAGLATLGGCFLVYTGFALSWRRFLGRKQN
ncbi:MAG TPA: PepSY-associated TM helix domain-containing protein [Opitutus sp.]|nr:PepSY-associated TM helix domain-containing protein [Opitutus sp.]